MNIRALRAEEYQAVDRLMQLLHSLHVTGRPDLYAPLAHPYSKDEFEQMVSDPKIISLAAEENGQVVGICFVTMREKSGMIPMVTAYMDDLVVDEAFRRRGIAKALYAAAEQQAVGLGAKRMDLMVWSFNEAAKGFYESLGMTPQRYIYEKQL